MNIRSWIAVPYRLQSAAIKAAEKKLRWYPVSIDCTVWQQYQDLA
ncbi:MAG: hypothetical protein Q7U66_10330 [Methylobacter sp.]|nr:hypothetical protein [Methylobacter sp.]